MNTAASAADSNCVIHQQLNDSQLIFDDDNTTCRRLNIEAGVSSTNLEVKPACVHTVDVGIFLICINNFIWTWKKEYSCFWRTLCF